MEADTAFAQQVTTKQGTFLPHPIQAAPHEGEEDKTEPSWAPNGHFISGSPLVMKTSGTGAEHCEGSDELGGAAQQPGSPGPSSLGMEGRAHPHVGSKDHCVLDTWET